MSNHRKWNSPTVGVIWKSGQARREFYIREFTHVRRRRQATAKQTF
jgi:hypothetical protein